MSSATPTPPANGGRAAAFLAGSPLGIRSYRLLYIGAVTTSMAYTMQSAMAGWLMANLSGSALLVGLVQAASTLPFLLFGLVSGSLADLLDRRYILIATHLMMGLATASVGLMSHAGWLQPWSLVVCTLLCGLGYTFYQPAQQASINGLVPRPLLPKAVALGSIAFNAARSVGPAMAGLIAALLGDGLAVLVAALFFLPMLPAAWQALEPRTPVPAGGGETLWSGLVSGLRFARHARVLRAALIINFCFCFCAAALWAMFPLVAQQRLGLQAGGYGFLYSTFGMGAVVSALWLPRFLRQGAGAARIIQATQWLWCMAALIVGLSHWVPVAVVGTFLAGMAWVGVLAGLSTVAQSIAPGWVRARAVANNQISVQAGLALGSLFWGWMVNRSDLQHVLIASAVLLGLFALASRRLPVRLGTDADVTPDDFLSAQWAGQGTVKDGPMPESSGTQCREAAASAPASEHAPAPGAGITGGLVRMYPALDAGEQPVRLQYLYRPATGQQGAFSQAMTGLRESRLRNGALRWRLQPDARQPGVWCESFELASAAEWRRFPTRMTQADRMAHEAVQATLAADDQRRNGRFEEGASS